MWGFCSPTKQFSGTQAGSPTIQLQFWHHMQKYHQTQQAEGLILQDFLPPSWTPVAVWVVTCASDQTVIDNPLPLDRINLLGSST